MSQQTQTRSNIKAHEDKARDLVRENPSITIEGFCARMQSEFDDCGDQGQLTHYYNQAKAVYGLVESVKDLRDTARQMVEKTNQILAHTL